MGVRENFYSSAWCRWVIRNASVNEDGAGGVEMTPPYLNHLAKGVGPPETHTGKRTIPYRKISHAESSFHTDHVLELPSVQSKRVAMLYLSGCDGATIDFEVGGGTTSIPIKAGALIVHPNLPHRVDSNCERHILGPFDVGDHHYKAVGDDPEASDVLGPFDVGDHHYEAVGDDPEASDDDGGCESHGQCPPGANIKGRSSALDLCEAQFQPRRQLPAAVPDLPGAQLTSAPRSSSSPATSVRPCSPA